MLRGSSGQGSASPRPNGREIIWTYQVILQAIIGSVREFRAAASARNCSYGGKKRKGGRVSLYARRAAGHETTLRCTSSGSIKEE
jgi:hypothetical protein